MTGLNGKDWRAANNARIAAGQRIEAPPRPELTGPQEDDGVTDPRKQFDKAPAYALGEGLLPQVFEDFVQDNCASWGGDPAVYATGFLAMHCAALDASVKVQTNPYKPDIYRNPNDYALILGKTGENKSGAYRDMTKYQAEWQKAISRAHLGKRGARKAVFMQATSSEALFNQIVDNQGSRLLMGSEEGMSIYEGIASHHRDASASQMSNALCAAYDGGMFLKRLAKDKAPIEIPEALATLISVTVIEKIAEWKAFPAMIESGLMARHTVGMIAHPLPRDASRLIPGADKAMADVMLALRGLKDVRFIPDKEAATRWLRYVELRESRTNRAEGARLSPGWTAWLRKYELRIMSLATIFQAYEFIAGGQRDYDAQEVPSTEEDASKDSKATKVVKTVELSESSILRAVRFFEDFLSPTQEYFYGIAQGVTEFQDELINFIARRVTTDDPNDPEARIISRNRLTWGGPYAIRGKAAGVQEAQRRWCKALLDHGIIEVYEKGGKPSRYPEDQAKWYKVRDEVFSHFSSEEDRDWLSSHDTYVQDVRQKIADDTRNPLKY
jgi:Protein of unknown function (DUF3987)